MLQSLLRPLAALLVLAAGTAAAQPTTVKYMMWDSLQLPAYRQCAADFERANPGLRIKVSQAGWGDYWTALSIGFIADSAPDVFVNHPGKYPEYARNGLLVDLAPYIRRDGLDLAQYTPGLLPVWQREGRQYGLPKDWDTVGLVVNLAHARKAGVSLAELQQMRWNPQDGGSFERVVRQLTVDTQGRRADEPGFDARSVAVHGFQIGSAGGMTGQVEWSHFAVSNGFRYQPAPWARQFLYDDPRLAETLQWLAGLPARGLSAPFQHAKSLGGGAMFIAGKAAMVPEGSWMVSYFANQAKFEYAWVPLPIGPTGRRASMLNGLADSIWAGSRHKEAAWRWVKYLASRECQQVVAGHGVIFPAILGLAEQAQAVQRRRGADTGALLQMAREHTYATPMADDAAQIEELMKGAIESVLAGREQAGPALKAANAQVNRLLQRGAR
jgi:multiple sugar transport system substrate-binding protein